MLTLSLSMKKPPNLWLLIRLVGSRIPIGDGYAVIANKGSEALIAQINQALLSMEEDGTYPQIYSNYFN